MEVPSKLDIPSDAEHKRPSITSTCSSEQSWLLCRNGGMKKDPRELITKFEWNIIHCAKESNHSGDCSVEKGEESSIQVRQVDKDWAEEIAKWREETFDMSAIRNLLDEQKMHQSELYVLQFARKREINQIMQQKKMDFIYKVPELRKRSRGVQRVDTEDHKNSANDISSQKSRLSNVCKRFLHNQRHMEIKSATGFTRQDSLRTLPPRIQGRIKLHKRKRFREF